MYVWIWNKQQIQPTIFNKKKVKINNASLFFPLDNLHTLLTIINTQRQQQLLQLIFFVHFLIHIFDSVYTRLFILSPGSLPFQFARCCLILHYYLLFNFSYCSFIVDSHHRHLSFCLSPFFLFLSLSATLIHPTPFLAHHSLQQQIALLASLLSLSELWRDSEVVILKIEE